MKKIKNIILRVLICLAILLYVLPFLLAQLFYWIITGREEKYTARLADYLTDRLEEL